MREHCDETKFLLWTDRQLPLFYMYTEHTQLQEVVKYNVLNFSN